MKCELYRILEIAGKVLFCSFICCILLGSFAMASFVIKHPSSDNFFGAIIFFIIMVGAAWILVASSKLKDDIS